MAYSDKDWAIVRAFYERGLSLNKILARPEVKIKAKSSIISKAAKEGWQRTAAKRHLVDLDVQTQQNLALVFDKKAELDATELYVHETLVDQQLDLLKDIQKFSSKAVQKAHELLDTVATGADLRQIAEAVDKISITNKINERHPKPATAVAVAGNLNFSAMSDEELWQQLKTVDEQLAALK